MSNNDTITQTPLQRWLAEKGMTIVDLSDALGWRYNYTADMVRGGRNVSPAFRWRFGEVYGFDHAMALFAEYDQAPVQ